MKCSSYDLFFSVFSNPTRMRIIRCLLCGEKSVSELASVLKEEQSKVSHNLAVLKRCNFIDARRSGKHRIYCLNEDTIRPLFALVEKHVQKYCCKRCNHAKGIS